jgi:hypothetical protein
MIDLVKPIVGQDENVLDFGDGSSGVVVEIRRSRTDQSSDGCHSRWAGIRSRAITDRWEGSI